MKTRKTAPPAKPAAHRRGPTTPAALMVAVRRIEVEDIPRPAPGPGEALIELTAIGICGSDLHYWRLGQIGDQTVRFPFRLGHEPAGIVTALGRGVRGLKEGQHVAVEPGMPCWRCRECLMGRSNLCRNMRFLGSPPVQGIFQRFAVLPAACLLPLPAGVDDALGAACEPLGIALHAYDLAGLRVGERVAILGGGPIGLCAAALARQLGAQVVALCEPRAHRQRVARRLGPAWVGAPDPDTGGRPVPLATSTPDTGQRPVPLATPAFVTGGTPVPRGFADAVNAATDGTGADLVLECAGVPEGMDVAISVAARGGRVVLVGIHEVNSINLDPHAWRRRELMLFNLRRSNAPLKRCLRLVQQTDLGLKAAGFFTGTVSLEGIQPALEQLDDPRSDLVKVMVDPRR